MTNTPDTWDHERTLNGLLSCVYCKSPMIKVGLNYICQAQVINPQVPCQTPRINAYELLQLTVNHIINRTINDQTTEQLKGIIQDKYTEKAKRSQDDLDQAENAITATEPTQERSNPHGRTPRQAVQQRGRRDRAAQPDQNRPVV